ncbi:NAP family protein [Talaromyces stipitatus ATCC 10500]|uniref:NAP family protein n=1 Tax=Talaromyces stipitatus (strain ATCC 10500 / CBS 375.48 / QM 6759 / NRRL 1006) TaxID=441959 RepID=B8M9H1_TALSN|nr:NAP family protein [Talaromyces stipitatus ATCC 10500]EED17731.1 NAP family protein [Talaromyces stipitatus ATCC 10500]
MSGDEAPSLWERISLPSIPKEVGRKISQLEQEFVRAELEQLRKQIPVLRPLYARRNALVASKELQDADFWPRVFANAPQEIDEYILASDAAVISQCLKNLTIERCDVDENGSGGDPRSVRFTFEFATGEEENPYFTNAQLVKEFHYRTKISKTPKGKRHVWEGYVSTPVRINWKKDQDLTKGLLDAACDLYEAEQKKGAGVDRTTLPEYEKLITKLEEASAEADALVGDEEEEADEEYLPGGVSFFNFFGYRGNTVTAEESAAAEKEEAERWQKIENGEKVDDEDDEDDDEDDDIDEEEESIATIEIFPAADDIAVALADDVWPNALKYYVQSYEVANDFDDEMDIEELDDDEGEDDEDRPAKKVKT